MGLTIRRFSCNDLISAHIPDESTVLAFPDLLKKHILGERIFMMVKTSLNKRGMTMRQGTTLDATLIVAPSYNKNKKSELDPKMHESNKGNQLYIY